MIHPQMLRRFDVGLRSCYPEMFVASLISRYRLQLTRIYNLGARNFILPNVGPIGCIPYQRDVNPLSGDECVALPNQLYQSFNIQLKSLLIELDGSLKGSRFIYADVCRKRTLLDCFSTYVE